MEVLTFFCINYGYGLELPAGDEAFPDIITMQQRRATSITVLFLVFLPHYF